MKVKRPKDIKELFNPEESEDMMTFADIGNELGISRQNARNIYKSAMRKLKQVLAKENIPQE